MNEACDHINSEVEQEAALKKKQARSVCLWVSDRASIHQNTMVPARTVALLSRLVAKRQNAE